MYDCPNCQHANMPYHIISDEVGYEDPDTHRMEDNSVICKYDDCICIRHLVLVQGKVNTRQSVSPLVIKG